MTETKEEKKREMHRMGNFLIEQRMKEIRWEVD